MKTQLTDNQILSKNFVSFVQFHFYLRRLAICSAILCLAFGLAINVNNATSFINVGSNSFLKELLYGELYDNFESSVFNLFTVSLCAYVFPKLTLLQLEKIEHPSTHYIKHKISISTTIKLSLLLSIIYAVGSLFANYCLYLLEF